MKLGDVPPPSWREQVGNALYIYAKWPADQINHYLDQLLAEHAHELAEKIRTAPLGTHALQKHQLRQAADLIDPKKEGQ